MFDKNKIIYKWACNLFSITLTVYDRNTQNTNMPYYLTEQRVNNVTMVYIIIVVVPPPFGLSQYFLSFVLQ